MYVDRLECYFGVSLNLVNFNDGCVQNCNTIDTNLRNLFSYCIIIFRDKDKQRYYFEVARLFCCSCLSEF